MIMLHISLIYLPFWVAVYPADEKNFFRISIRIYSDIPESAWEFKQKISLFPKIGM